MKAFITGILIILVFFPYAFAGEKSRQDHGEYWVDVYGALSEDDHPLVSRVQKVFERVLAAADKQAGRFPRLVILREIGNPWAISLRDGTVLLTRKALEICYRDVEETTGDARAAFVLGHELAHLAKDHFWHIAAFEAMTKYGSDQKAVDEIVRLLCKTGDIKDTARAREVIREKELQADHYGFLYASMAGYDPLVIVDRGGKNFFREWADGIAGKLACDDRLHPTSKERAEFLLSNMKKVTDNICLFHIGVRLYQLARYKDALDFLQAFREEFPCREVFSNIGLIYYQMAMTHLYECDRNAAYRYNLSTVLDTETLASEMKVRRSSSDECIKKREFRESINWAIRHLKLACEKDTSYIPARINLSSAYIMARKYSDAMAVLDEALEIREDIPEALNNRAVAMYLLGPSIRMDMFKQSYDALKELTRTNPEFSDAYYNLARILSERKRHAAAKEAWKKFLDIEPSGPYAETARAVLENRKPSSDKPSESDSCKGKFHEPAPFKLGRTDKQTRTALSGLDKTHDLELGRVFGKYYEGENLRVLTLEGVTEVIESRVRKPVTLSEIISKYGPPCRTFASPSGMKTLMYYDFALDVHGEQVLWVIHFKRE